MGLSVINKGVLVKGNDGGFYLRGVNGKLGIFRAIKIALARYDKGVGICVCKSGLIPGKGLIGFFYKVHAVKVNRNRGFKCGSVIGGA